ncbi:MAG TPA: type II toxin-antitoxin system RelE/ParE family toxin [Chitinophagales bacterium]|nr:type II toxin-antitoxin system RelE/ParE family toxin [Chitinophagales bacterium]
MSYSIKLLPAAKVDIAEAKEWYEERRENLGVEFKEEVSAFIENLKENPSGFQVWHKQVRKVITRRFPYVIYFKIYESLKQVVILGVLHGKRERESIMKSRK